jgi:hypothetical protein
MLFQNPQKKHPWEIYRFPSHEEAKAFAEAQGYLTVTRLAEDDSWQVQVHLYIKIYKN